MTNRSLEQGVQAIQSGNHDEGARLLRIALKDETLAPPMRVSALMWLAETNADVSFKIQCYQQALAIDPANQDVNQRLAYWLTQQLPGTSAITGDSQSFQPQADPGQPTYNQPYPQGTPPQGMPAYNQPPQTLPGQPAYNQPYPQGTPPQGTPPQGMPAYNQPPQTLPGQPAYNQPYPQGTPPQGMPAYNQPYPQGTPPQGMPPQNVPRPDPQAPGGQGAVISGPQRSVGILGGPHGEGTGIFVTHEGLVATSRSVVGANNLVEVLLLNGQRVRARVVRAFPEYDLALIETGLKVQQLLRATHTPVVPENTTLIAVTHHGDGIRGARRATQHQSAPRWIPTTINHRADAGGNPIFDETHALVGLLMRVANRSSGFYFGLHISMVFHCVERFYAERQQAGQPLGYCPDCGSATRAMNFNGYYCETCGATLEYAAEIMRMPQPNLGALYGENAHRPCPNCQARVGYDGNKCLRCGWDPRDKAYIS